MEKGTDMGQLPSRLTRIDFNPPVFTYPGKIAEVQLGATRAEGGSRGKVIKIGGEKAPPFYLFESPTPLRPAIALDVFDMPIPLPGPLKEPYKEVMDDPAAWAKLCVEKLGADLVSIHLVSTDPRVKDTSPQDAAKTVEEILQAVDVPIIIGGSGDNVKDPAVFAKVAETAEGERCMLASVTPDSNVEAITKVALQHGHVLLAWTPVDMGIQRRLNQSLIKSGLPKDRIVMDPTTASLGYGLEYTFTVMERIRLAALKGDEMLQMPMSSGSTNAWGAREAWLDTPELGPREQRGPLWEAVTALTMLLAGVDIFMMMHPTAFKVVKKTIDSLIGAAKPEELFLKEWVKMETRDW